jgi:predicted MPP superfamily phosphohydrolase
MRRRFVVFMGFLITLWLYTALKAQGLFPGHAVVAWAGALALFVFMTGSFFLYHARPERIRARWFRVYAYPASLTLSGWAAFVILMLPVDGVVLILTVLRRIGGAGAWSPAARAALFQQIPAALAVFALFSVLAGLAQALRGPRFKEVALPVPHLPAGLEGLRAVLISDTHVSATLPRFYLPRVVKRINALKPDLILFPGDLADGAPHALADRLAPLGELRAPLGKFFSTGNHEYYWGPVENWLSQLRTLGFTPLINEHRTVDFNGVTLRLAGVTDPMAALLTPRDAPNLEKALGGAAPAPFTLLLAHQTETAFEAVKRGVNVQVSGHTHGGQCFPFNLIVAMVKPFYKGVNRLGGLTLYTTCGTGYWGPPNRFLVPAEVTVLRFEPAEEPALA